jgi:Zn-dependent protease with chaperone function
VSVRLRAWLAVLLLVGYFVGLFALLALLPVVALAIVFSSLWLGRLLPVAGFWVVYLTYAAVKRTRQVARVRRTRVEQSSVWLIPTTHPELWRTVNELAQTASTTAPDEVKATIGLTAAVWEESRLLGLRRGRRHLVIGLPLLAGLTVDELRAVLSHELGHFSRPNGIVHRATIAIGQTSTQLTGFVQWAFGCYAKLFRLVAEPVNQAQELAAEAASVQAAGKEATRSALLKLLALDQAWSLFWTEYFQLAWSAQRTPDLLQGFRAFLANPDRVRQLAQGNAHGETRIPMFAGHPTLQVRLAALDTLTEPDRVADNRPAWQLLADPETTIAKLDGQLGENLWPRASWAEIVQIASAAAVARSTSELAALAKQSRVVQRGDIGEVLEAIDRGTAPQLIAYVGRDRLISLVNDAITDALIRTGLAHHELTWSGPPRVRLANGEQLDIREWLAQAIDDPFHLPELRQWLAGLGLGNASTLGIDSV